MEPGDKVTITEAGKDHMKNAIISHYCRAIYGIIGDSGGILESIECDTARVFISPEKFPHCNRVGVFTEHLNKQE